MSLNRRTPFLWILETSSRTAPFLFFEQHNSRTRKESPISLNSSALFSSCSWNKPFLKQINKSFDSCFAFFFFSFLFFSFLFFSFLFFSFLLPETKKQKLLILWKKRSKAAEEKKSGSWNKQPCLFLKQTLLFLKQINKRFVFFFCFFWKQTLLFLKQINKRLLVVST